MWSGAIAANRRYRGEALLRAVRDTYLPEGEGYVWAAGEVRHDARGALPPVHRTRRRQIAHSRGQLLETGRRSGPRNSRRLKPRGVAPSVAERQLAQCRSGLDHYSRILPMYSISTRHERRLVMAARADAIHHHHGLHGHDAVGPADHARASASRRPHLRRRCRPIRGARACRDCSPPPISTASTGASCC